MASPQRASLIFFLLVVFLVCQQSVLHASQVEDEKSLFQMLADSDDKPLIKIETDLKKLIRHKLKEEYQLGVVTLNVAGEPWVFNTQLRARGNIRKEVCYYPPIKIKFDKLELEQRGLKKLHKLKLVLPCRNSNRAEENMYKEHLIYDIYSQLDPHYVATKLVTIEFWHEGELKKTLEGILIEEEKHFQKRYDAKIIETGKIVSTKLVRDQYAKVCFFQYMIANTDWSIFNKHNIELVALGEGKYIAVPYDFDYAGIINNSYAVPSENLGIQYVTQRYYMGKQMTLDEANRAADFFLDNRSKIEKICESATYLDESERKSFNRFITDFYKLIDSEKEIKRNYVNYKELRKSKKN